MQPTPPGWYFDPRGRPSLWRWFTGRQWTEWLSADPHAPPPTRQPALTPAADGRLHAGGLAFPILPSPWRAAPDYVGFGGGIGQELVVAQSGRGPYIAGVFIGQLATETQAHYGGPGDLAAVTETLTATLLATFYPHERPHSPVAYAARDIDNRRAHQATVTLDIDDDRLDFDTEDVAVIIVDSGMGREGGAGVLYASLPATDPVPPMSSIIDELHVSAPS